MAKKSVCKERLLQIMAQSPLRSRSQRRVHRDKLANEPSLIPLIPNTFVLKAKVGGWVRLLLQGLTQLPLARRRLRFDQQSSWGKPVAFSRSGDGGGVGGGQEGSLRPQVV